MYHVYELIVEEMNTEYLQGRRCTSRTMTNLFFFSSRRRHTRCSRDWSSDVCSSDLYRAKVSLAVEGGRGRSRTVGFHPYYQPGRVFSLVDCHITDFRLMALWRELKPRLDLPPARLTRLTVRLPPPGRRPPPPGSSRGPRAPAP